MFAAIGRFTYAFRYTIIAVLFVSIALSGVWGFLSLGKATKMSGLYDEGSDSVAASILSDQAAGRMAQSDILVLVKPKDGAKVTDPEVSKAVDAARATILGKYATGDDAKLRSENKDEPQQGPVSYTMPGLSSIMSKTDSEGTTWVSSRSRSNRPTIPSAVRTGWNCRVR